MSALGAEGLDHVKQRIEALAATPVAVPPKGEWEAVGYGSGGATYVHQMEERSRQSMVGMVLKDIAAAMGDVDAFIAQYDPKTQKVPKIAAEIATRLLAVGRAEDAQGVQSRHLIDWIQGELFRYDCPLFADELKGREAFEGLQSSPEVVGADDQ